MSFAMLVRYSKLVRYGVLAVVGAVGLTGYGMLSQLPTEADLQTVTGTVEKATKVTTKRRRSGESVNYKLEIKDDKAANFELTLPAAEITEQQVRAVLNARTMTAKFDGESDVYVLTADGRQIISYAATRRRRENSNAGLVEMGAALGGGGLLLVLIGWLWNRRAVVA